MPQNITEEIGLPRPGKTRTISADALLAAGVRWEETVVERLGDRVLVADGDGPIAKRWFSPTETIEQLRALKPGEYLYQPTISPPPSFLRGFGVPDSLGIIDEVRPDLIVCISSEDGGTRLQVIDVKGSHHLKGSHRIQVTLYAMILEALCSAEGIGHVVDMEQGAVWLSDTDKPEPFALLPSLRIVGDFLRWDLVSILQAPLEQVGWHLYYRCEWCSYYPACRQEADNVLLPSVSKLPYLTPGGRQFLRKAPWPDGTSINTLPEFREFIHREDSGRLIAQSGSLRNLRNRLIAEADALDGDTPVPIGGASIALPRREGVRLAITLQRDPVSGRVYAAGFRRFGGQRVYETTADAQVFVAASPAEYDAVAYDFLHAIHAALSRLDVFNQDPNRGGSRLSLQTYVFDMPEERLFTDLVFDALGKPELAPIALDLLFYYQDTSVAAADRTPRDEVPFPIVCITTAIQQLLALPIPVFYRLRDVAWKLRREKSDYYLRTDDRYWYDYSNMVRSDAVLAAWGESNSRKRGFLIEGIRHELENRLTATTWIVDYLRRAVPAGSLFADGRIFAFPDAWPFRYPELSRLAFIVRYEALLGALERRKLRAKPEPDRRTEGISIPLVREGNDRWRLETPLDRHVFEKYCGGSQCLLTPAGDDGDRMALLHDDYRWRRQSWTSDPDYAYAWVPEAGDNDMVARTSFDVENGAFNEACPVGSAVVLHTMFKDYAVDAVIAELHRINEQDAPDLLRLLSEPTAYAVPVNETADVYAEAWGGMDKFELDGSQKRAFEQLLTNRLTLLWGPPGTGKTYCLRAMIACLARGRSGRGQRMRILVTAANHPTVNQVLRKIHEALGEWRPLPPEDVEIHKLEKFTTTQQRPPEGSPITVISMENFNRGRGVRGLPIMIVGGTMQALRKVRHDALPYDLLVVDEASQVKWGELTLALHHLAPDGKILLAGDDLQLPPIIHGTYPESADELPGLHDSVFAYLRKRDDRERPRYTRQLLKNRRMNHTLSRFPAVTLYGERYVPANEGIGSRALALVPSRIGTGNNQWKIIEWLLDPAFPLALVVIENVQATVENPAEAEIVACVTWWLCLRLSGDDSRRFLAEDICVVSPHHAQIHAIRSQLANLTNDADALLIDTVEKVQGDEKDTVLVSYGVSDAETALAEAEFIYGLNRLNVANTRAKKKCVVFLPRPLLRPTYQLLENKSALDGLSHMIGLQNFCRENGEEESFVWDSEAVQAPVALTALRARWVPPLEGPI